MPRDRGLWLTSSFWYGQRSIQGGNQITTESVRSCRARNRRLRASALDRLRMAVTDQAMTAMLDRLGN